MIKYIKMKFMEARLKYVLYSSILTLLEEHKDMTELIRKLYDALKDVPSEELKSELIAQIASLAHDQVHKDGGIL